MFDKEIIDHVLPALWPALPPANHCGVHRGMMTVGRVSMRSLMRTALALLLPVAAQSVSAQIIEGLQAKVNISGYATMPFNVTPNYRYFNTPLLTGYSLGGFIQSPYLVGVEVRGQIQRRVNAQHQESALIGPRVAMRFGRFTPYVSALGGAGNGWRFRQPPIPSERTPRPVEGLGPQWTVIGGVDFKLNHYLYVRMGEVSYSQLYLKNWTLTPVNLTTGIVLRIN